MDQTPPTLAQTVQDQLEAMQRFAQAASAGFVDDEGNSEEAQTLPSKPRAFEVELLDAWALP